MRRAKFGISGGAIIAGLSLATASHAANLSINDSVPGQITLNWSDFQFGVTIDGGPYLPVTSSATVAGETVSFFGDWYDLTAGNTGAGVIYIVDPGQPNIVRARIDAVWTDVFNDAQFDTLDVTSSPFGSDLGTLPPAFAGLGIPMPNGSVSITGMFRDPVTASPVSHPPILTLQYVGDLVPECEHPVLFQQLPDQANGSFSDLDPSGSSFETAESVVFAQDVTIRSLRWWGIYYATGTPMADSLRFRVYEDAAGVPASIAFAEFPLNPVRVGNGTSNSAVPEFAYASNLPAGLTLKAGVTYWVVLVNDTSNDANDQWAWTSGAGADIARAVRNNTGGPWGVSDSFSMALEFCGSTTSLDCPSDFNGDGLTSGADLAVLLANWGPCGPALPLVVPTEPANRIDMLMNPADDASSVTSTQR